MKLRDAPDTFGRKATWKLVSTLTGLVGALIARRLLQAAWSAVSDGGEKGPVLDPADRRFNWKDAVLWVVTASIGVGVARIVSSRIAVAGWEVATGTLPPGVEEPIEI